MALTSVVLPNSNVRSDGNKFDSNDEELRVRRGAVRDERLTGETPIDAGSHVPLEREPTCSDIRKLARFRSLFALESLKTPGNDSLACWKGPGSCAWRKEALAAPERASIDRETDASRSERTPFRPLPLSYHSGVGR